MAKDYITLPPIFEDKAYQDEIEKRILEMFKREFYYPLLNYLNIGRPNRQILNSSEYWFAKEILNGKIYYSNGKFHGQFNSKISKQLMNFGAKWNKKDSTYVIALDKLPLNIRSTISLSSARYGEQLNDIIKHLDKFDIESMIGNLNVTPIFDKNLEKIDKSFEESIKSISIVPRLTKFQREKIASEYQNNMELYIKTFSEKMIVDLRKDVQDNVFSKGNRREALIKDFMKSYNVTENKAKFWARQETNLLMAKYKETKYTQAGSEEYEWKCVHMPHQPSPKTPYKPGEVRYSHGILENKVFRWNDPPVTTAPDQPQRRNNPGQDYQCLPSNAFVSFYGSINKAFRRRYSGELTELITSNGMIIRTTRNHPILTQRGWIAAQQVNIGDNVFTSQEESLFTVEMKSKNMKPTCEQIFDAFSFCSQITSDICTSSDFHNDIGENNEIDIISINSELILKFFIEAYNQIFHFIFEGANSSTFSFGSFNILRDKLLGSHTSSSLMSIFSELDLILFSHGIHPDIIGFRSRTNRNIQFDEPFSDNTSTDVISFCNSNLTHPILIILNSILIEGKGVNRLKSPINSDAEISKSFTQQVGINAEDLTKFDQSDVMGFVKSLSVIDKRITNFSGHIYNFETSTNWFYTENIIIHNCRCFALPIIRFK